VARESFEGTAYRQCHPDHIDFAETIRASLRHPYRFNPAGEFGALYLAVAPEIARAELERQAARIGVEIEKMAPRVMLHVDVRLQHVLDLTDARIRQEWDVTEQDLASDHYARCQEVARVARREGYEAILYPSAAAEGDNLAVFYDQLRAGSWANVSRTADLPLSPRRIQIHWPNWFKRE